MVCCAEISRGEPHDDQTMCRNTRKVSIPLFFNIFHLQLQIAIIKISLVGDTRVNKAIFSFSVTNDLVLPYLEGLTVEEALEKKRLFIVDYNVTHGVQVMDGFHVSSTLDIFFFPFSKLRTKNM